MTVFHNWATEAQALVIGDIYGNVEFWALEEIIFEHEKAEA